MTLYIPSILHSKVCVQSGVAIPVVDVELVNLIFKTRVCVSLDR